MGVTTRMYAGADGSRWPTVSLIVPVPDGARWLDAALSSLCNQVYVGEKPELIVALAACRDASREVARRYPLKILENDTPSLAGAANLGASIATGELLVFADSDATLPPTGIQEIVEPLRAQRRAVATVRGRSGAEGFVARLLRRLSCLRGERDGSLASCPVLAVHTEVFDTLRGFDEETGNRARQDFVRRAAMEGAAMIRVDAIEARTLAPARSERAW